MKSEEIEDSNLVQLVQDDNTEFGGIKLRQITAGTLALCSLAKLAIVTGETENPDMFEVMAFLYIHAVPLKESKGLILSKGEKDDLGRNISFVSEVLTWADEKLKGANLEAGLDKVADMLEQAFTGSIETIDDDAPNENLSKKKE